MYKKYFKLYFFFITVLAVLYLFSSPLFAQTEKGNASVTGAVDNIDVASEIIPLEDRFGLATERVKRKDFSLRFLNTEKEVEKAEENENPLETETPGPEEISEKPSPSPVIKDFNQALEKEKGAPVILHGETLFYVKEGLGPYTKEERAKVVSDRLKILLSDPEFSPEFIQVIEKDNDAYIVYEDKSIMTITGEEVSQGKYNVEAVAKDYAEAMKKSIGDYKEQRSAKGIINSVVKAVIASLIFLFVFIIINRVFAFIYKKVEGWKGSRIKDMTFQKVTLLSSDTIVKSIVLILKTILYVINVSLLYIYFSLVLGFFVWTRAISTKLFDYVEAVLYKIFTAFIGYLPNLFFILITVYFISYLLRFFQFLFRELDKGTIAFPGFKQEWSRPTYKIIYFLVIALSIALIFPLLPGAEHPAFKGLSLFIGILFSLGSTSAISNVVAGTILIYTDAFKIGDRVKIGNTTGDIVEKTLLVTRLKTIKNVYVTIPNSTILNSEIVNYSASLRDEGLILNTTVTLGYDVPWRKVKKVLVDAALSTKRILKDPPPFVLQTSLDDYYVSYQLNAYTGEPGKMAKIYSALHENIQDKCNEADIEILSPHYRSVRDGNMITIPSEYLPKDYSAPPFKISKIIEEEKKG